MQAVIIAALLAVASVAVAEEAAARETRVVSEKELIEDDGTPVRLSLPTEADSAQWEEPGLRIGIAYSRGQSWGRGPALDLTLDAFTVRALMRIDRSWSLGLDFQYALATSELRGLRYASTVQAIFHPRRSIGITFGAGLGGLVLVPPIPTTTRPGNGEEVASVTFGDDAKLGSCSGSAWVGLARAEYQFVVGPLFASGPFLEVHSQYTRCEQTLGRTDCETGQPIVGRQWWFGNALAGGWWFSWR